MNIRTRLSLTFFSIVVVILTLSSIAVYYFAENNRREDFYRRLRNRAINTTRVITEVREVSAELQRRLEENNPASLPDQYIIIIDSAGNEIYRSTGPDRLPVDTAILEKVKRQETARYTLDHREVLAFTFSNRHGRYIILATAWDQFGNEGITNLGNILEGTVSISILLVSLLSWFYSGRVLKPISKIIREVDNINEKNLSLRVDAGNQNDELGKLARTFNNMLSRLQNSFVTQKSFIANASHEIKTPITIMSGEVEVSLLQQRDNAYYTKVLKSVLNGLKKLNTLSTQLLLLAESSNQDPGRRFSSFRLDDILWETKDWLIRAFPIYQVEIHFDLGIDLDAFSLVGDEHLIRVAIFNLMDNGCKYSPDNQVSIVVDTKQRDWLTLSFINSGTIHPEDIDKIFSPFFRGHANKTEKGFGIGLSLASNVVKLHNGQLSVTSSDDIVEFVLKLPVTG